MGRDRVITHTKHPLFTTGAEHVLGLGRGTGEHTDRHVDGAELKEVHVDGGAVAGVHVRVGRADEGLASELFIGRVHELRDLKEKHDLDADARGCIETDLPVVPQTNHSLHLELVPSHELWLH